MKWFRLFTLAPSPAFTVTARVLIVVSFFVVVFGCQHANEWPRLKQLDPSLSILGEPKRLLNVACNHVDQAAGSKGDSGLDSPINTRHEAVRALLALQGKRFNVHLAPIPSRDTTGIDHILVTTLQSSGDAVKLLVTPTLVADRKAREGDYWSVEQLTFDANGKLLNRQPYKE